MNITKKPANSQQPATARVLKMMKQAGVMRTRELTGKGVHRVHLQRLEQRGLYRLAGAELSEHESFIEAAKLVPHGVLCLFSALNFHNLTTQDPLQTIDQPPILRCNRLRAIAKKQGEQLQNVLKPLWPGTVALSS